MKQHPIPHNILDIEFKLFTKFTIREFAYMVMGVGGGGIFLYLYTIDMLPAIIAVPIFIVGSLIGLFLGLVPINDQKADVYLTNYIFAITRPTLRAWKNEQFDEKVQNIAESRGLTLTQGTMDRNQPANSNAAGTQIIGGSALPGTASTTTEDTEKLDAQEMERIRKIEEAIASDPVLSQQLENFATTLPETPGGQINSTQISQQQTQAPVTQVTAQPAQSSVEQPIQPTTQVAQQSALQPVDHLQSTQPAVTSTPQIDPITLPEAPAPSQSDLTAQTAPPVQGEQIAQFQANSAGQGNPLNIKINQAIAQQQKSELKSLPDQTNSIMLQLVDSQNQPVPGVLVIVKDSSFKPVTARQTDQEGLFLPNKQLQSGLYKIEIIDQKNHFPTIDFLIENGNYPLIKVKALAE